MVFITRGRHAVHVLVYAEILHRKGQSTMTQQFGYPEGAVVDDHGYLTTPVPSGLPLPDSTGWWEYHRSGEKLSYVIVQMMYPSFAAPLAPYTYFIDEDGYSVSRRVDGSWAAIWLRRLSDEEAIERELKVPDYSEES